MDKKLLIVEDEDDIREMMRIVLEKRGYYVATAGNGIEALAKIREDKPDLIITDILMPEMDGYQLFLELRVENFANIPILVVTARGLMEDSFRAMGVEDFIMKPFTPEQLCSRIELIFQLVELKKKNKRSARDGDEAVPSHDVLAEAVSRKSVRWNPWRNVPFFLGSFVVFLIMVCGIFYYSRIMGVAVDDSRRVPKTYSVSEPEHSSTFFIGDSQRTLSSGSLQGNDEEGEGTVILMDGEYQERDENGVLRYEYLYRSGDLIRKKTYDKGGLLIQVESFK